MIRIDDFLDRLQRAAARRPISRRNSRRVITSAGEGEDDKGLASVFGTHP